MSDATAPEQAEADVHGEEPVAVEHAAPVVHQRPHPTPVTYVAVASILAVVTAAEIMLFYAKDLSQTLNTVLLLVLMVLKFTLVALWFMHLRFDRPIFRRLFVGGIMLALVVYAVALAASGVFPVFVD